MVAESAVFGLGFDAAERKMSEGRITVRLSGKTRVGITLVAVNEIVAVEKVAAAAAVVVVVVVVVVVATAIVLYSFPPPKNWTDLESFLVDDAIASPS